MGESEENNTLETCQREEGLKRRVEHEDFAFWLSRITYINTQNCLL
jgi:hypothetical protein